MTLNIDEKSKLIEIGYEKTCDCKPNHLNCQTAKEWIKQQLGVWQVYYEGRDMRNKKVHPATFPIALSSKVISLFTHEGELVLDPFVGSGTTLVSARDLNRNAVGFDLKQEYVDVCNERLMSDTLFNDSKQVAICDDALNIQEYLKSE